MSEAAILKPNGNEHRPEQLGPPAQRLVRYRRAGSLDSWHTRRRHQLMLGRRQLNSSRELTFPQGTQNTSFPPVAVDGAIPAHNSAAGACWSRADPC
jgi:hypothetical protein